MCVCNNMVKDLNTDKAYPIGAAFFSGFLFSAWSWGIIYLLLFLLAYEIGYYIYCSGYEKQWDMISRIGIVAGAFMGFLIGRAIIEDDDHDQSIRDFCDKYL